VNHILDNTYKEFSNEDNFAKTSTQMGQFCDKRTNSC